MKTRIISKNNSRMEDIIHVDYRRTSSNRLYKPCTNKKGLHCEGDQFGYVVDWQITDKKRETVLVR